MDGLEEGKIPRRMTFNRPRSANIGGGDGPKQIVPLYEYKEDGEIGEDVRRIMEAIESAGLCGPRIPDNEQVSRPGTQGGFSNGTGNRPLSRSRPTTAASLNKEANMNSPTKSRPSTAASATRKDQNGVSGIPTSPAQLPPKAVLSANYLRPSTARVSDRASPAETATGPNNATGSSFTPRLRPSSSLYRPTASSALKRVSSATDSSASNPNLPSSRSSTMMADSTGGSGEGTPATLQDQFAAFARFGNKGEDGKHITLFNCDKWMKLAKVIDGRKITTTDTSICFKKLFKTAKKITFEDFKKYVEELAKSKKMGSTYQELLDKLTNSGAPHKSS